MSADSSDSGEPPTRTTSSGSSSSVVNRMGFRVDYKALKYTAPIEELGATFVARFHQDQKPYIALHLSPPNETMFNVQNHRQGHLALA
ncbi:hypothetical protein Scep_004243 [Stephania cephalantha]|uniref:Uncharacterized protein n=1 Tax=Stephania cephalantha TaxID=152367 RepID=A0AAP0KTP3_9MAGN